MERNPNGLLLFVLGHVLLAAWTWRDIQQRPYPALDLADGFTSPKERVGVGVKDIDISLQGTLAARRALVSDRTAECMILLAVPPCRDFVTRLPVRL